MFSYYMIVTGCHWLLVLSNSRSCGYMCRLKCADRKAFSSIFLWLFAKLLHKGDNNNLKPNTTEVLPAPKPSSKWCIAKFRVTAHHKDVLAGGICWHVLSCASELYQRFDFGCILFLGIHAAGNWTCTWCMARKDEKIRTRDAEKAANPFITSLPESAFAGWRLAKLWTVRNLPITNPQKWFFIKV